MDAQSEPAAATAQPAAKHRRPIAITIVGVILILTGLLNLFVGAVYIWASTGVAIEGNKITVEDLFSDSPLDDPEEILGEGALYAILGLVQLVISIGFWRLARWAWVAAMTWQAVKLLFEVVNFFVADVTVISLVFTILLVLLLNQSDVRLTFRILNRPHESPKPSVRRFDVN